MPRWNNPGDAGRPRELECRSGGEQNGEHRHGLSHGDQGHVSYDDIRLVFFLLFLYHVLYGMRTGIVFLIFLSLYVLFLSLRFLTWRANPLEGSSLTTSLRYQDLLSFL